jgi:hypothetical protein
MSFRVGRDSDGISAWKQTEPPPRPEGAWP